jgi:hypothetical protein
LDLSRRHHQHTFSERLKTTLYSIQSWSRQCTQGHRYTLLKPTSQRRCISNVCHYPGYGLDAWAKVVTTWRRSVSVGRPKHWTELNTVWL